MKYTEQDKDKFQQVVDQVTENGISKADVISFENMIGSNFITGHKGWNRFTDSRTSVNAEYVIERARDAIENINKELTKYTVLDVCKKATTVLQLVESVHYDLTKISEALNSVECSEKLERTLNEKYCLKYYDDEVRDITKDEGFVNAIRYNRNYLQAIAGSRVDSYDYILGEVETFVNDNADYKGEFSPLLSTIKNDAVSFLWSQSSRPNTYEDFYISIRNVIDFAKSYKATNSENMEYSINLMKSIVDDYNNKSRIFELYDYRQTTNTYNQLETIGSLFNDQLATLVISVLKRLYV